MNPFVASQLNILVEDLRLLEAYITAPLGLYSDLRMLREALPLEEASELAQSEKQQRRLGYRGLSERPAEIALAIADQVELILKIFEKDGTGVLFEGKKGSYLQQLPVDPHHNPGLQFE